MASPRPRAILVDMDDTILAAGQRPEVLLAVAREFAAELAPHAPEPVAERLETELTLFWSDPERHKVARFSIEEARRGVVREAFATLPPLTPDLADRFAARFSAVRDAMGTCFPGALEGLQALKDLGIRLALVTNGSSATQRAKIERFGLAAFFDHIQIEGEVGFGKPEPQAYHHAMAALGSEPHETWMVGDHLDWEVRAPQALGMTAVWCDGFAKGLPANAPCTPDHVVVSLSEIPELFAV